MEALVAKKNSLLKALNSHSCVKAPYIPSENNSIFEAINCKEDVVGLRTLSEKRSATLTSTLNLEECSEGNKTSVDKSSVDKNTETKSEEYNLGKEFSVIETRTDSVTPMDKSNIEDNLKSYMIDRTHEKGSDTYSKDSDDSFEYSDDTESPILKMLTNNSGEVPNTSNNSKIKDLVDNT